VLVFGLSVRNRRCDGQCRREPDYLDKPHGAPQGVCPRVE
jgi:hypothetical protein